MVNRVLMKQYLKELEAECDDLRERIDIAISYMVEHNDKTMGNQYDIVIKKLAEPESE